MTRSTVSIIALAALAFAAAAATRAAEATPAPAGPGAPLPMTSPLAARLDTAVGALARGDAGAPAVSVALVEHGALVYAHAAGTANLATKTAATVHTRFRIASLTKMLTAVAVMQLVERGTLGLDATVATYVPSAPHAAEVTVRELLAHRSGLSNYGDEVVADGRAATTHATPDAILAVVAGRPLDFAPGAKFEYSNTNYVLLGLIVEAVAHAPLASVIATQVLAPAGMTETTFGAPPPVPDVALGYLAQAKPAPIYDGSWFYADGDAFSTATDLARFDIALMDGKLVSRATLATMTASPDPAEATKSHFGFGLITTRVGDVALVGHHGGLPGFAAEDEMLVDDGFAMIALGNDSAFTTALANRAMLQVAYPAFLAYAATTAPPPAAASPGDAAAIARFRTFYAGLVAGRIDRTAVTPEFDRAMTNEALGQIGAGLAAFGTPGAVTVLNRIVQGKITAYVLGVGFSSQVRRFTFALDAENKVAGFFIAG